jgi:DNA-binding response OmpR family regulator
LTASASLPRILILEEDATQRHQLSTAIRRQLTCEIVAAENGVEALVKLSSEKFELVVLDEDARLMSGLEVLQEMRKHASTADLPVVMLSDTPKAASLQELVGLGIADYIVKPFSNQTVTEKIVSVLANRKRQLEPLRLSSQPSSSSDTRLELLIVDPDSHFRHFLRSILSSNFNLLEAASGAEALLMALKHRPNAVLVGHDLGVLSRETLARKLRDNSGLQPPMLIATVLQGESENPEPPPSYDAFVVRSMVSETFLKYFNRLFFTEEDYSDRVRALIPNLPIDLCSAVEQILGMMMQSEVTLAVEPPARAPDCLMSCASIDLADGTRDLRITLRIQTQRGSAVTLTSLMMGLPENEVTDEELISGTMQEMGNLIGGRLKHATSELGLSFNLKLPSVQQVPFSTLTPLPGMVAEKHFSAQGKAPFTVLVGVTACQRVKVLSTELKPGMILAEDVIVAGGKLPKGFRLTPNRVSALARDKAHDIEVIDA